MSTFIRNGLTSMFKKKKNPTVIDSNLTEVKISTRRFEGIPYAVRSFKEEFKDTNVWSVDTCTNLDGAPMTKLKVFKSNESCWAYVITARNWIDWVGYDYFVLMTLCDEGFSHPNIQRFCSQNTFYFEDRIIFTFHETYIRLIRTCSRNKPWEENDIAAISVEVLMALKFLHSHQISHRDIRSSNIGVSNSGDVKLLSYQYCLKFEANHPRVRKHLARRSASFAGSLWMAPEMITSIVGNNGKSDIWSFGIFLLELVDGVPPGFDRSQNPFQIFKYLMHREHPPTLLHPERNSKLFCNFLGKILVTDMKKRWNAAELLNHEFVFQASSKYCLVNKVFGNYLSV